MKINVCHCSDQSVAQHQKINIAALFILARRNKEKGTEKVKRCKDKKS